MKIWPAAALTSKLFVGAQQYIRAPKDTGEFSMSLDTRSMSMPPLVTEYVEEATDNNYGIEAEEAIVEEAGVEGSGQQPFIRAPQDFAHFSMALSMLPKLTAPLGKEYSGEVADAEDIKYEGSHVEGVGNSGKVGSGGSTKNSSMTKSSKKKGGKSSYQDNDGGCHGGHAFVTVTNLSFRQSFSEIFVMTATRDVTQRHPIFIFGNQTNAALAELATNADASEMLNRYENRSGVEQTKIFDDFEFGNNNFLNGGTRARFKVRTTGFGHRLSIAAGLPFTNDGAVVLQGARIYDGAEYWIPAIDAGVEGNAQTCWSVAATRGDFPSQSVCSEEDISNENDNFGAGENFVSMHRGIWDADDKGELELVLFYPTCKEMDLDDCDSQCFGKYFYKTGINDEDLLCRSGSPGPFPCDFMDDQDILDNIEIRSDTINIFDLARQSDDFGDFCDIIDDRNKDIEDAFVVLEQAIFDWRNDIMLVEIDCE